MSAERVERLRVWHEQAYAGGRRDHDVTVEHLGFQIVVPPDVYPPNPLGLAELVLQEVRADDRVLDMGTGSGIQCAGGGGGLVSGCRRRHQPKCGDLRDAERRA
jgi:methylase of polypeptide subunit release factors